MKCIIYTNSSEIFRVSNEVARSLTSAGKASYTNKAAWRKQRDQDNAAEAA